MRTNAKSVRCRTFTSALLAYTTCTNHRNAVFNAASTGIPFTRNNLITLSHDSRNNELFAALSDATYKRCNARADAPQVVKREYDRLLPLRAAT